ncbi:SDR family NAD(P)-dependent oxidoreductase [Candidatus Avoscillospira sp. LCP25S3_F1]|uniref:SDR family NAD(P)-dependent oxidoreductase n=1 Tax=Candidatus Avoscillospira sp. LCP25S3_F1 TaxID=3438825 RepID=UPI003F8E5571
MEKILMGKNCVITGARRGIGRAAVEVFAQNGANVWACARRQDAQFEQEMAQLAEESGVWIHPVYFDLADEAATKAAVKTIMSEKIPVDAVVNIAGITYNALFQMTNRSSLEEVMQIDFVAPYFFTQSMVKLLQRNPSKNTSIVNISSSAALDANSGRSAYGASKAALLCATKAMAEELGAVGIRANSIAPGITDTDMVGESMTPAVIEETVAQTALHRMGRPEEIAHAAAFLASDLSSYVTGQVLRVDGGM